MAINRPGISGAPISASPIAGGSFVDPVEHNAEASITLANATIAAAGAVTVAGTAAITLDDATVVGNVILAGLGQSAITLDDAELEADGTLLITGQLTIRRRGGISSHPISAVPIGGRFSLPLSAIWLDSATVVASGVSQRFAQSAITLADATVAATGLLTHAGEIIVTLDNVTAGVIGDTRQHRMVARTVAAISMKASTRSGGAMRARVHGG
jgi:hypothetical protein